MLDRLIHGSLNNRLMVMVLAGVLLALGGAQLARRPVDIFPDLNQPTVTVIADAHGLAPEEMETLVTLPLESALGGLPGVSRIISTSGDGLSLLRVDFDWNTDIYRNRQMIQERLQLAREDLPAGVNPEMAPVSSITGEIQNLGLASPDGSVSQMELNTLAEWVVRRQLMSVPGVAQVVIVGGEKQQYQVLADPDLLLRHDIGLSELGEVLGAATGNSSGGYLPQDNRELLVRNLGRLNNTEDIADVVIDGRRVRPVRVGDVAEVVIGPEYARGAAAIDGVSGVVLLIFKQPGVNTLALSELIDQEVKKIRTALPEGVQLRSDLYRQATFLQRGVDNVIEALRDGSILVVLIIFIFLVNLRASLITLVALPLSFATTGILFAAMGLTINTMTLGGLAIAVGELVDDAIVGVENIVRRLRQRKDNSKAIIDIIADASTEVRQPIFTGTLIVVLVFLPLFGLSGIEGRLFKPMAIAYVTSLLASMVISLTVTPVLSYLLFKNKALATEAKPEKPALALIWLRAVTAKLIAASIHRRKPVVVVFVLLVMVAGAGTTMLGSEFLPPFDEGTILVMSYLPPGTSLAESDRIAGELEDKLVGMEGIQSVSRYTGRGQHDEHAPPVTISHLLLTLDQESGIAHQEMESRVRDRLGSQTGLTLNIGQPLAHRIDHLLSGLQAEIAIKVMGPDMDQLRTVAQEVRQVARTVPGVTDLYVEPQVLVPQMHVDMDRERLAEVGLTPGALAEDLEMALGGEIVADILEGERSFDLFVRLKQSSRDSRDAMHRLPIRLPGGGWARLGDLATVEEAAGPNSISRDNMVRRIAVTCNTEGRSMGEVVHDLQEALKPLEAKLPQGTSIRYEGQFESQMRATRLILLLSILSLAIIVFILYFQFRSMNLAFQVLTCVPAAFVGGLALLILTNQPFSIAALVGFVSLAGIATRNGILLIDHYRHLMLEEKLSLTPDLLIRAGQERAAPVVMTALTTGVGLLPLLLSAGETGREILYPVATVVIGGLMTSTLLEFILRPAVFWMFGRKAAMGLNGDRN
jgi:CzcA family heavy metal efflux pump